MQKRLTWIAAIVVAGAASAGIASATARLTAPDAVVHACANATNGLLRLVDEGASCRENETAAEWNVHGPPGPAGASGAGGTARAARRLRPARVDAERRRDRTAGHGAGGRAV